MNKVTRCSDGLHCWHVERSNTDGLAESGWDDERCCWCNVTRRHPWRVRQHRGHGPHVKVQEMVYAD